MYINDIKILAKNEKELETLIQTIRIYNQDIGIEFDILKSGMVVMKSRKRKTAEGIELRHQENIKRWEKKKIIRTQEYWKWTPSNKHWWKKNKKSVPQKNEKASRNKAQTQKSHQRDKQMGSSSCKIIWSIIKMDKGVTEINEPKDKKIDDYA